MRLSDNENTIIDAMARAFFVCAYATQQEEREAAGKRANVAHGGTDWMDIAPRTPRYAREFALMFAGGLPNINVLVNYAAWADALAEHDITLGSDNNIYRTSPEGVTWEEMEERVSELKTDSYLHDFGHCLAMMGAGTGVSWFDDHARFAVNVPHVEVYI